jgi:hypothetical protein
MNDPRIQEFEGDGVEEADFAREHDDVTLADELPDGPERAPADESVPAGLAGADPDEE